MFGPLYKVQAIAAAWSTKLQYLGESAQHGGIEAILRRGNTGRTGVGLNCQVPRHQRQELFFSLYALVLWTGFQERAPARHIYTTHPCEHTESIDQ